MNEIAEWGPSDHCRLMIEVKDNARVAVPKESRAARFIQPTSGVEVIYADARGEATLNAPIARTTEYWWSENQPDARSLWESKIELGEDFFNEVITNPVPLDMNILKSLTRSPLGLDLYLWLTYRTFNLKRPLRLTWPQLYRQFGADPARAGDTNTVNGFRTKCLRELKKIQRPWPDLHYRTVKGALVLSPLQLRLVE